jgi:hypothetical protein
MNQVHTLLHHFFRIHFNIMFLFVLRSSMWSLPFRVSYKNFVLFSSSFDVMDLPACPNSELRRNYEFYVQLLGLLGERSACHKAITYTGQHKQRKTLVPRMGFEPTIPVFECANISCLRSQGHCDRLHYFLERKI